MPLGETPRYKSFCAHAILHDEPLIVSDTTKDERFCNNEFVVGEPYLRFYAGFVLKSYDNYKLGTLCIMGPEPRELSFADQQALNDLGLTTQDALQSLRHEDKDIPTGLYNRRGFLSIAQFLLSNCKKKECFASLLYFDLTNYETVLKKQENADGLTALIKFAEILKETFNTNDIIARIDNSRFVVLTVHSKNIAADSYCERVKDKIHYLMTAVDEKLSLEFRSGLITSLPEYFENTGRLIDLVDKRMNEFKYSFVYEI